jgi:metal-responsive CopG/Arc/MetJ family transcriptional regulator
MSRSIKLNADLWHRVTEYAAKAGYSSVQEFIEHLVEKELSRQEEAEAREEMERRLRGLGYLE